jgi:CRP-like cAMP-binding protein
MVDNNVRSPAGVQPAAGKPRYGLADFPVMVPARLESVMDNVNIEAAAYPMRSLAPGEVLITQGEMGGDIYFVESGDLIVERDGVRLASIVTPGALLGEMSVLLDIPHSATVRAESAARVRVIANARTVFEQQPALSFRLARLLAARLNSTSALLVDLTRQGDSYQERGLLGRIMAALHLDSADAYATVSRGDLFGGSDTNSRD